MEVKEIEFEKLRHAYIIVKQFLETEGYIEVKSLDAMLAGNLGLTGDDAFELLVKFVTKFELDHKNFDFDKHFLGEGELFEANLLKLLALSVWLPFKTIELITFNKVKFDKSNFQIKPERKDLTFKELIIWYVEKEFKPLESVKYKIKYTNVNA